MDRPIIVKVVRLLHSGTDARRIARSAEIADRFILDAGHPGAREILAPQQAGELDRAPAVGLDLVALQTDEKGSRLGHG
jgi:hypothetical protein